MKLAEFSVKQSLFINLLSIFLVIAGAFTLINMQREAFPNITFDIVTITTSYPGASPEEVEKLITTPLEKEVKKVDGIKEMVSSSRENSSLIYVEIDPDASDKDKVVNDVQRAVDRFNDLPDDANDPVVTEVTTKEMAILEVSLSGDLSEKKLQLYAESLEDRIEDIDGVAAVKRNGFREREIWVEVDPEKMREYYVSLEEVMAALKARNISISGGDLIEGSTEFNIRTTGEFYTAKEVADVIIRANDAGNWLRVKDVAVVKDGYKDENLIHKTRGTQAINLVVTKRESGDAISIVEDIDRVLDDFKKSAPAELQFSIVKDLSFYIKRRLNVLKRNAVIGVILVISSLLLFLNRRVAIMTTLGIPIAFLTTFAVMGYMGISINLISMFGLIIVLGMIVDDGIIISENVYRHMEEGLSPRQAAIVGTSEVMKPVFATIATTMAAFSSLFFMSGIMGRYVRNIPIVVIVALMASMMEAFIILPSHLADFVRPIKNKVGKIMSKKESPWFASILNSYTALLKGAMKNRYKVCLVVIAVFILCLGLVFSGVMRFSLFGSGGVEEFYVRAEAPVGTPLEVTSGMVSKIEDIITTLPPEYMDTFTTTVGRSGEDYGFDPYGRQGSNMAQIAVYLTPSQTRKREAQDIMEDLRKTVEEAKVPGFEKVAFFIPEHGPP
ncbi:MAG: efflux RND transporter permease subunit, partial [Candidatus Omnitrophica bacterium]|nr:efflux RND transporter permease subunit [Candidatus Omnitrophota bacterium]